MRTSVCLALIVLLVCGSNLFAAQPVSKETSKSLECNKRIAKVFVHCVASGLGSILKNIKNKKERIDMIRAFINPIRFFPDQSGYFYVYDLNCTNIAHATQKNLQGKNLQGHKDSRGKYVIRELSKMSKEGGGFVEFYWVKPGEQEEHPKLGYVEPIPNTSYFIGTGIYLDEK